jgi:hypothetical protein
VNQMLRTALLLSSVCVATLAWHQPFSETSRCFAQSASAEANAAVDEAASPEKNSSSESDSTSEQATKGGRAKKTAEGDWISLRGHWEPCQFGGEGEVTIKDGVIKMDRGEPLTGVRWKGAFEGGEDAESKETESKEIESKEKGDSQTPSAEAIGALPRDNYEIRWECRRDKGFDFLCAFTFPIADQYASFVMGGWGGGITGISSIDGRDASDNDTTMFKAFDNEQWYKARVRVESEKITVWVDDVKLFAHPRAGFEFDIRFEMDPCTPLGIANFQCQSTVRNVQLRRLKAGKTTTPADGTP